MENETMLKEILNTFKLYSENMDKKLDEKLDKKLNEFRDEIRAEIRAGFADVNKRLDRLTARQDGTQADLIETKETVHFLHSKVLQHEKKLHQLHSDPE